DVRASRRCSNCVIWILAAATKSGFSIVAALRHLCYLALCSNITDAGLASVAFLPQLQHLGLGYCHNITDVGLDSIAALHQLHGVPGHQRLSQGHGCGPRERFLAAATAKPSPLGLQQNYRRWTCTGFVLAVTETCVVRFVCGTQTSFQY
ncbi:receptor-type protein kinase, putative, partial [Bodo saltans]